MRLITDTPDPELSLPYRQRITPERLSETAPVVVNSAVFRSSGQNLTTAGVWIEMASRLFEPALLGLLALAVRSRVKR